MFLSFYTIINYTFESVWSSRHSFRYSAMAESDFTPAQTEKLTMLTGLGLPEAQAKKSVATDAAGAPAAACPCSCYW